MNKATEEYTWSCHEFLLSVSVNEATEEYTW